MGGPRQQAYYNKEEGFQILNLKSQISNWRGDTGLARQADLAGRVSLAADAAFRAGAWFHKCQKWRLSRKGGRTKIITSTKQKRITRLKILIKQSNKRACQDSGGAGPISGERGSFEL